ncbi:MAG: SET domain-containing protein [Nanoarchaeota archaeon]
MNKKEELLYVGRKIVIGRSQIHRLGAMAKKKIKRGEVIFLIKGKKKFWNAKNVKDSLYGKNWMGIGKNLWIIPVVGHGRYVNHSCDPSASVIGRVTVVALRERNGDSHHYSKYEYEI